MDLASRMVCLTYLLICSCPALLRFLDTCLILMNLAYTSELIKNDYNQHLTESIVFAALRMFALCGLSKQIFTLVLCVGLLGPLAQIVRSLLSFPVSSS